MDRRATGLSRGARRGAWAMACVVSWMAATAQASVPDRTPPPRRSENSYRQHEYHENVQKGLAIGALGVGVGASAVLLTVASPALALGAVVVGTGLVAAGLVVVTVNVFRTVREDFRERSSRRRAVDPAPGMPGSGTNAGRFEPTADPGRGRRPASPSSTAAGAGTER